MISKISSDFSCLRLSVIRLGLSVALTVLFVTENGLGQQGSGLTVTLDHKPEDTIWEFQANDRDLAIHWTGGGPLEEFHTLFRRWRPVAEASPYTTKRGEIGLYRAQNVWHSPVDLYVPSRYDEEEPLPLVLLLHGRIALTPGYLEDALKLEALSEREGKAFLLAHPVGRVDEDGFHSWDPLMKEDSRYLRAVIDEISQRYAVDPRRVYCIGHSRGGGMTYAMGCRHADLLAGIVVMHAQNRMHVLEEGSCEPSEPVPLLHIHGTDDSIYASGQNSTAIWSEFNGHDESVTSDGPVLDVDGNEDLDTEVTQWTGGSPNGAVTFWAIQGGGHNPSPRYDKETRSTGLAVQVIDWLFEHSKP